MPTSLMGLSPTEISAISSRRMASESRDLGQLQSIIKALGDQRKAGLEREKFELEQEKFDFEKAPPMVQMKTEGGQIYEVPKEAQAEGIKAKAYVDELYRTGRMDKAKHTAWMKPVVMSIPDKAGKWISYEVPSGMLQTTAAAAKDLQALRVSGVEEERRRKGFEALGGQTIGDIKDVSMATMLGIRPEAMETMITEAGKIKPLVGGKGLKPEERRKLIKDHAENAFKIKQEGKETSDASIAAYNDQSKDLGYPSMMVRTDVPGALWGTSEKVVEVKLPVVGGKQITPTQIYDAAEARQVAVNEILKTIYEGQLAMESSKR